jgi:hypothetical protein
MAPSDHLRFPRVATKRDLKDRTSFVDERPVYTGPIEPVNRNILAACLSLASLALLALLPYRRVLPTRLKKRNYDPS